MKIKAALFILALAGCNTVSPEDCRVNPSGGAGGSGTLPIGAGVGATSGGDRDEPGPTPQDAEDGERANPCSDFTDPPPIKPKPLEPGQAVCVVTWDRASRLCRIVNGGDPQPTDCTSNWQTKEKYDNVPQANEACRLWHLDIHEPPNVKSCACVLVT